MRNRLSFTLCLVCLAALGCAPRAGKAPREPDRVSEHRPDEKSKKQERPVVAPPPAYGNKVVLDGLREPPSDEAASGARPALSDAR